MSTTRSANMEKRRARILAEARTLLSRKGFDALNLRDLADVSEVTVPTIYNLIGNKEEILKALMMGAFGDYEEELERRLPCPASKRTELMGDVLLGLIARDEEFYRASALANERLESHPTQQRDYGFRRLTIKQYMKDLCQSLSEEGLLKGDIPQELLVEQMVSRHQVAFRDWAHRITTLEEFKAHSMAGFYVTLAADAVDSYRDQIVKALPKL
jgi:AcrR family transcriptional regulator